MCQYGRTKQCHYRSLIDKRSQVVYTVLLKGLLDLLVPFSDALGDHRVADLVASLKDIHSLTHDRLVTIVARYKKVAGVHRRDVVLTRDQFPAHEYNKLASRKISPIEVIEKINPNSYRLCLPSHMRMSDVFNVKHLVPFVGDNSSGDETALVFLAVFDPLKVDS
ncbi:hypothetical protein C2S52_015262 [Perilla frutescens var. hirtella]|nr:hypothetical protein C2S52_015262 [Perilla frutescens var. hirtella]